MPKTPTKKSSRQERTKEVKWYLLPDSQSTITSPVKTRVSETRDNVRADTAEEHDMKIYEIILAFRDYRKNPLLPPASRPSILYIANTVITFHPRGPTPIEVYLWPDYYSPDRTDVNYSGPETVKFEENLLTFSDTQLKEYFKDLCSDHRVFIPCRKVSSIYGGSFDAEKWIDASSRQRRHLELQAALPTTAGPSTSTGMPTTN